MYRYGYLTKQLANITKQLNRRPTRSTFLEQGCLLRRRFRRKIFVSDSLLRSCFPSGRWKRLIGVHGCDVSTSRKLQFIPDSCHERVNQHGHHEQDQHLLHGVMFFGVMFLEPTCQLMSGDHSYAVHRTAHGTRCKHWWSQSYAIVIGRSPRRVQYKVDDR